MRFRRRRPWPLVVVTWVDAHPTCDRWTPHADLDIEDRPIQTAGWLLAEDRHHVVVGLSWDPATDSVDQALTIPATAVRSVRRR